MSVDFGYPEINKLNELYVKHQFTSQIDRKELLGDKMYYPKVHFSLSGQSFYLYIDDEYDDLRKNYPLLNLCLILRELEGYEFTSEFDAWCQERYLDVDNPMIVNNFNHLEHTYQQITNLLGKIDSFVSDFDFEMNARAAQKLRRSK